MAKFIYVQRASFNQDRQIVDADYQTILNTDFIELVEPFEQSRNDPGRYARIRYQGMEMLIKGSVANFMEKVH